MQLQTLGSLVLRKVPLKRVKPLLLLAFLALEGRQERDRLARLFFGGTSDPRDGLSSALGWLRRTDPSLIHAVEDRLETGVRTDAHELRDAFGDQQYERVAEVYSGPFAAGLSLDLGEELEEWVYRQREHLAQLAREALLQRALMGGAAAEFSRAAELAAQAWRFPEAPPLAPMELPRILLLLRAGEHVLADEVRAEAREFGLTLDVTPQGARAQLRRILLAREAERAALRALEPGQWCWVQGGPGMGKSALLADLGGHLMPGRSYLPLATLTPLLGELTAGHPAAQLRALAALEQPLLIDDWEAVDAASRELLMQMRATRAPTRVVIAARTASAVDVDCVLFLGPLLQEELAALPGAFEATGGLPTLVAAFARGERLTPTLEGQLSMLTPHARMLFEALTLLDEPDLVLVGRALELDGPLLAAGLSELLNAGLVDASGHIRASTAARDLMERRLVMTAPTALRLARQLEGKSALLLYERVRPFWSAQDLLHIRSAAYGWASRLLREGRPQAAVEVLRRVPSDESLQRLLAEALQDAGRFEEAWQILERLEDTPKTLVLKATMLRRRGYPEAAMTAVERALEGPPGVRARALHVQAKLNIEAGDLDTGAGRLRASAGLYLMLGNDTERGEVLNELARVQAERGEDAEQAFLLALSASKNPILRTRILVNLGKVYERQGNAARAEEAYREALSETERTGALDSASRVWNNLGVLYHNAARTDEAAAAYLQGLQAARATGEVLVQATALGNLAELHADVDALREAIRVLEQAGHTAMAAQFRSQLQSMAPAQEYEGLHRLN